MANVRVMKRGKVYQYQFEIAKVDGKRKYINKSGFATRKEAFDEGTTGYSSLDELKGNVDSVDIREGLMAEKTVGFLVDNANVVEPAN